MAAQLVVCEFTVTSLDEKLVYEFRVSAQNQVGMSLPCDLEGAVIPKEILGEDLIINNVAVIETTRQHWKSVRDEHTDM